MVALKTKRLGGLVRLGGEGGVFEGAGHVSMTKAEGGGVYFRQ